tara:strand:- start:22 stop:204 length:183 start_codon:yes stop_codon:yes gene_type:complete
MKTEFKMRIKTKGVKVDRYEASLFFSLGELREVCSPVKKLRIAAWFKSSRDWSLYGVVGY